MSKTRLLIIDDQLEVRAEVKDRIESLGHDADEAACQEDALKKIEGMQYDCVLLDLMIPVKLEGVPRIEHGKNLLQRIVALAGAPPVIVITSHGLDGHKLAVEMMEIGAKSFVAKPFDGGQLEPKILRVLASLKSISSDEAGGRKSFDGGALIMNGNGIELCGILVGGVRTDSIIRRVVERLATKKDGKFLKASAKTLTSSIPNCSTPQALTAAINDFRDQCTDKLLKAGIDCGKDAVIHTAKGGGYQFRDWIQIRIGREGELSTVVEEDCAQVMRAFNRNKKLTVKEVRDLVALTAFRTQAAVATLEGRGRIKNVGGSGSTTTYERISE